MADDIYKKLLNVQTKLHIPKKRFNSFSNFHYRNCEDILEAVKPLLAEEELTLIIHDDIVVKENGWTYVRANAVIQDTEGHQIAGVGYAREPEEKKKMDDAQVTGTSSSYARKYALAGLFLIDSMDDADSMDNAESATSKSTASKAKAKPVVTKNSVVDGVKKQASATIHRYCELHNADEKAIKNGILKRPNYADTVEFWTGILQEFENANRKDTTGD